MSDTVPNIAANLIAVEQEIADACNRSGRARKEVKLIAVSKTWEADVVAKAVDAGQIVFGENKLQEGQQKIPALPSHLEWHFIGGLQRNKVRKVLGLFHVIHSIDSLKLASYTDGVAKDMGITANILLQINMGDEQSKGGFSPEEIKVNFADLLALKNLNIKGLMCIPRPSENKGETRAYFQSLKHLKDQLEISHNISLPELSMGMSSDYPIAVEEGATLVRVGSSIFGNRTYSNTVNH